MRHLRVLFKRRKKNTRFYHQLLNKQISFADRQTDRQTEKGDSGQTNKQTFGNPRQFPLNLGTRDNEWENERESNDAPEMLGLKKKSDRKSEVLTGNFCTFVFFVRKLIHWNLGLWLICYAVHVFVRGWYGKRICFCSVSFWMSFWTQGCFARSGYFDTSF